MENRTIETFFELFLTELEENEQLREYHRFINDPNLYLFRRAYYQQRLEYVMKHIQEPDAKILDVGCGYGTTSILLAYLGYKSTGTTLEYYFDEINNRLEFWKNHLDTSLLNFKYENILKADYAENSFDYIIAQDTLHHIEPISDAMVVFSKILTPEGKLISCEENDKNLVTSMKRFKMRGFNRVIKLHDEKLNETFLLGNENTRSMNKWRRVFKRGGLKVDEKSIEYIRIMPPTVFQNHSMEDVIKREQVIWKRNKILRDYFFFGMNFCASKS